MSNSRVRGSDFERWVAGEFTRTAGFTMLILLVKIGSTSVTPVASSYLHVIGDNVAWPDFLMLLDRSGKKWDGVALFPHCAAKGGPIPDRLAKVRLEDLQRRVTEDRMTINEGGFFDRWGRKMIVEEVAS